jgi:hypothetical protein
VAVGVDELFDVVFVLFGSVLVEVVEALEGSDELLLAANTLECVFAPRNSQPAMNAITKYCL